MSKKYVLWLCARTLIGHVNTLCLLLVLAWDCSPMLCWCPSHFRQRTCPNLEGSDIPRRIDSSRHWQEVREQRLVSVGTQIGTSYNRTISCSESVTVRLTHAWVLCLLLLVAACYWNIGKTVPNWLVCVKRLTSYNSTFSCSESVKTCMALLPYVPMLYVCTYICTCIHSSKWYSLKRTTENVNFTDYLGMLSQS